MFRNWLKFPNRKAAFPPPNPEIPFTAIGDIHGRVDLLKRFLSNRPEGQIICVGDYVDRGENSAEVLQLLQSEPDIICLSGNHEEMLLSYLDDPVAHSTRWLRYGGLQTLASFRIIAPSESADDSTMRDTAQQLRDVMGEPTIKWLRNLPAHWQTGNVAVVHAGADPAMPIDMQHKRTLHWGHRDFARVSRTDGIWVVHGHTIVDQPMYERGRISIDTGAYATGQLTAALIGAGSVKFETSR